MQGREESVGVLDLPSPTSTECLLARRRKDGTLLDRGSSHVGNMWRMEEVEQD